MSSSNKYHVVKFLELPSPDTDGLVCVPDSWITYYRNRVDVAYPTTKSNTINEMVIKHEKSSNDWSKHSVDIKYTTEHYEEAIDYINKDKTIEKLVNDVNDLNLRLIQLEKNYNKLLSDSGGNTPITPSPAKDKVKPTIKSNDLGNSSPIASGEKVKRKIQPTAFGSHTPTASSAKKEEVKRKIQPTASGSNTPVASSTPKGDESLNKTFSQYDHEDLSWTLKYNKNSEGVEEFIKGSGVYVKADALKDIAQYNTEIMTSMLLKEIFTKEALEVCTCTGKNTKRPALHHNASKYLIKYVLDNGFNSDGSRPTKDSVMNVIQTELKNKKRTTK